MITRTLLSSSSNPHIKAARALLNKRGRLSAQRYLIEGYRLVRHALTCGCIPQAVFLTEDMADGARGRELAALLKGTCCEVFGVTAVVLAALSDTVTPQGVVAVMPLPGPTAEPVHNASLVLLLDDVRDPGNLGTILRTAQASGVGAVLLTPTCTDPYAPKVVRSAMGAHLALPILSDVPWDRVPSLLEGKRCVLADPSAERDLWHVDMRAPLALVVSNEARGASREARGLATDCVRIPLAQGVESLNVAVAASVLVYEVLRQRTKSARTGSTERPG